MIIFTKYTVYTNAVGYALAKTVTVCFKTIYKERKYHHYDESNMNITIGEIFMYEIGKILSERQSGVE